MTQSIEQIAREIADKVCPGIGRIGTPSVRKAAIVGIKLGREQAAVIADELSGAILGEGEFDIAQRIALKTLAAKIRKLP